MPRITCSERLTAAISSAARNASPKLSTRMSCGRMSAASISSQASANSTSRKPIATMNGSRSAARIGGSTALSTAIAAAPANAAPVVSSPKPGSTHAATVSEAAATSQPTSTRSGRRRRWSGSQFAASPYDRGSIAIAQSWYSSRRSARMIRAAASSSARWENACGKFPRWRPVAVSNSSA